MINNLQSQIEVLTKMPIEEQNQKLRLFARLDIATRVLICDKQKSVFHVLRSHNSKVHKSELTYSSLILAIAIVLYEMNPESINALLIRAKKFNPQKKRQKLLNYWAIVKQLKREENMSFRDISDYLRKHRKFEVSYSLIYQMWHELEKKDEKGSDNVE